MSKKDHVSETPATRLLKSHKIAFTEHPYEYLEHGGAQHSAEVLGLDPFTVVKPLVMQDQDGWVFGVRAQIRPAIGWPCGCDALRRCEIGV